MNVRRRVIRLMNFGKVTKPGNIRDTDPLATVGLAFFLRDQPKQEVRKPTEIDQY